MLALPNKFELTSVLLAFQDRCQSFGSEVWNFRESAVVILLRLTI